jgi:hypothetical protein
MAMPFLFYLVGLVLAANDALQFPAGIYRN